MTPEEKAREILAIIKPPNAYSEIDVEHVAQALRDVERETLERAAKIASDLALKEQKLRDASDDDDAVSSAESRRVTAAYIAQSIRSLLQKEGG